MCSGKILAVLWVLPLLLACPGETGSPIDTGMRPDGSSAVDSAGGSDTVVTDVTVSDHNAPDTTVADTHGGVDLYSTDSVGVDAGIHDVNSTPDSTMVYPDAGLPPQGDNVIVNGSFEQWSDAAPVAWMGATTNASTEIIVEDASHAHDGVKACQFINPESGHLRLSTAAATWVAGRYHCSYWIRGGGEIRNARYDGDYSSYTSYTLVDADQWHAVTYNFSLVDDVNDVFELIFSVRNTLPERGHLQIDDVRCTRDIEPCDSIDCESWQRCDNDLAACVSATGFCADSSECETWQQCDVEHHCVTAAGFCANTADCDEPTPVCNPTTHICEDGDPCLNVDCPEEWRTCDPATAQCVLVDGRCRTTLDCSASLPVCNISNHSCEAIDSPANVVPNGGFEVWEDVSFGTSTVHLPAYWYGVCDGCSPYYPDSTASFDSIAAYTANTHSGSTALQIRKFGQPADRFVSEPFSLQATTTYSCAYWVRGHGDHRQRAYCGGWTPDTDYMSIDSDEWQQVGFEINTNVSWCVLIFYVSNTDADRDHVQIDDVVCSKKY